MMKFLLFVCWICLVTGQNLSLPPLDYNYDDFEPIIDESTMRIHHLKHHQGYTNKLNKVLENMRKNGNELKALAKLGIDTLLTLLENVPEPYRTGLRNNGGGYVNHALFFKCLRPASKNASSLNYPVPSSSIYKAIVKQWNKFEDFQKAFDNVSSKVFGSGWTWLYYNKDTKELAITSTQNQDSPAMSLNKVPLLVVDEWEHAYYLKYQNRRGDWTNAWWKIVNWDYVDELYQDISSNNKDEL